MDVYWLEQTESDVPVENDWLCARETVCLAALRIPKRRADWRVGRWTAKRAVAVYLNVPAHPEVLARIEVRPAPSGAPEVLFSNKPAAVTISLSHRNGTAVCAVAPPDVELGCDLELVEPHSGAFISDYFTAEEQALAARAPAADRDRLFALLWSAKESALKELHEGLRVDTRSVIVSLGHVSCDLYGWSPMEVLHSDGRIFHGWWQHADSMVRTLVAAPPPNPPVRLQIPVYVSDTAYVCA